LAGSQPSNEADARRPEAACGLPGDIGPGWAQGQPVEGLVG
jgi:hypothetical protein